MFRYLVLLVNVVFFTSACQSISKDSLLYHELGGQPGVERISEAFIKVVINDPRVEQHFSDSNLDRFYEKLSEQLCELSGGPCHYTGDDMVTVHKGMNISEAEFNVIVEIMKLALENTEIDIATQNRLLSKLALMRSDILYR